VIGTPKDHAKQQKVPAAEAANETMSQNSCFATLAMFFQL
jgi:hypothetical protein